MKVLIAWSGKTSQEVASILKSWLPLMNPHIEAFFSEEAIYMGLDWDNTRLRGILNCDCALFCFTQDNINSPWLHYEAGMIDSVEKPVIPVLFDVSRLTGHLSHFQTATFEKQSVWEMVCFLNHLCGQNAVSTQELHKKFEELYPTVEKMAEQVRDSQKKQPEQGTEDLKRDFATVNSKLDAILSRLSKASPGDSYPRQENSL